MPGLLVSVRSVDEALRALEGGADLIDIKEPAHGALGRANNTTISAIVSAIDGRAPVSAALGEWRDFVPGSEPPGVTMVKWGPIGLDQASAMTFGWTNTGPQRVLVAYADGRTPDVMPLDSLLEVALSIRPTAFLIDTCRKDGSTLLDHQSIDVLIQIRTALASKEVPLALAGSLGPTQIELLRVVRPAWFAVRGAACEGGREGTVCTDRVRRLKELVSHAD